MEASPTKQQQQLLADLEATAADLDKRKGFKKPHFFFAKQTDIGPSGRALMHASTRTRALT